MANHSQFLSLAAVAVIATVFFTGAAAAATYNVKSLGAKADGRTDATKAFMAAWFSVCGSVKPATLYVPKGRYMVGALQFTGPCKNGAITVRIDGILVAPSNYYVLGNSQFWLRFYGIQGVTIVGGTLDAQGAGLWACKSKGSNHCPDGATVLVISCC